MLDVVVYNKSVNWQVEYTSKAVKQLKKIPAPLKDTVLALVMDIEKKGPVRGDWPNFSKIGLSDYHCHLKKRKTYLCCLLENIKQKQKNN